MTRKPLTDEERRILRAAGEGRLLVNDAGRYIIEGEDRPDRKARERMVKRHYLRWVYAAGRRPLVLTPAGREEALDA